MEWLFECGTTSSRLGPDANLLASRWRSLAEAGEWRAAYETAVAWTRAFPHMPEPWLAKAEATRRVPELGLSNAIDLLRRISSQFPNEPEVPFLLARFTCQLGRLGDSHQWWMAALHISKRQGTDREWKRRALREPDLQALWTAEALT